MVVGSFEAEDPEAAIKRAESPPWKEDVLDGQESSDPDIGYILVVPDEEEPEPDPNEYDTSDYYDNEYDVP
jgi:hypothetical protein